MVGLQDGARDSLSRGYSQVQVQVQGQGQGQVTGNRY